MDVKEAIRTRRSIKHYDPSHQMTEAEVQELMEHAILSPTAFNIQHWRFVRVQDKNKRQQIFEAAWGQAQVVDASELLVLCADLNAWEKEPKRYWRNAPQAAQDAILPAIENYYANHHQGQRDEAIRSASIAAMNIMLMARGMGYDSCPMDGFDFDKVAKILQDAHQRAGQLPLEEVLLTDGF